MIGLNLALILSGTPCCLSFRRRLGGLVVFHIEAQRHFHLDPCLGVGIKGKVILAFAYGSVYLQTQLDPEEHVLVVVSDVSTLAGSDIIGAKQRNDVIGALLCQRKLQKGCICAVLSQGYPAIEEVLCRPPGMITIWVPRTVFIPRGSGVTEKILFGEHHSVPFPRVDGCIDLKHVLDSLDTNPEVLLLMASIVEQ